MPPPTDTMDNPLRTQLPPAVAEDGAFPESRDSGDQTRGTPMGGVANNTAADAAGVSAERHVYQEVPLAQIIVPDGRRSPDPESVAALAKSMMAVGQLQPIGLTADFHLIYGGTAGDKNIPPMDANGESASTSDAGVAPNTKCKSHEK